MYEAIQNIMQGKIIFFTKIIFYFFVLMLIINALISNSNNLEYILILIFAGVTELFIYLLRNRKK